MRSHLLLLGVLCLLPVPGTAWATKLTETQINTLLAEYVEEATSKERRAAILAQMVEAKPGQTAKRPLAKLIDKEETRGAALNVAVALLTPGLVPKTKKLIDSEHEEAITNLVAATGTTSDHRFLASRWAKADLKSETFEHTSKAFLAYPIGFSAVELIKSTMTGKATPKEKQSKAGAILKFQLDLETGEPDEIRRQWSAIKTRFKLTTGRVRSPGTALMKAPGWVTKRTRPSGENIKLPVRGRATLKRLPRWIQGTSFTLYAHVYVAAREIQGTVFRLLNDLDKSYSVKIGPADEFVTSEGQAPRKLNRWNQVRWEVRVDPTKPKTRTVNIYVNNVLVLKRGKIDGVITELRCKSDGERGFIVVGGVSIKRGVPPPLEDE